MSPAVSGGALVRVELGERPDVLELIDEGGNVLLRLLRRLLAPAAAAVTPRAGQ